MDAKEVERLLDGISLIARSNPVDMRAEQYDGDPDAALEILTADGMIETMINDAYDAITMAKEAGVETLYFGVMNSYIEEFDQTYPAENNMELLFKSREMYLNDQYYAKIIGPNVMIHRGGNLSSLNYYFDRGEYANYFVEDFAPALAVVAEEIANDGYNVCSSIERSLGLFWGIAKLLVKITVKGERSVDVYENNIRLTRDGQNVGEQYGAGFLIDLR